MKHGFRYAHRVQWSVLIGLYPVIVLKPCENLFISRIKQFIYIIAADFFQSSICVRDIEFWENEGDALCKRAYEFYHDEMKKEAYQTIYIHYCSRLFSVQYLRPQHALCPASHRNSNHTPAREKTRQNHCCIRPLPASTVPLSPARTRQVCSSHRCWHSQAGKAHKANCHAVSPHEISLSAKVLHNNRMAALTFCNILRKILRMANEAWFPLCIQSSVERM